MNPGALKTRYFSLISLPAPYFWKSWAGGEEGSGERAPEDPGDGWEVSIEVSIGGLLMGRS